MLLKRRRPARLDLVWAARPKRTPHQFLGTKSLWIERSRTYEVIRFSEGVGDYQVLKRGHRIAVKKSLSGAKRAAANDARQSGELALRALPFREW